MKFRRFTKASFLRQIGRGMLAQFLDRFRQDLTGKGLVLPDPTLSDEAYFDAVARLALAPEGLPDELIEAIYGIETMSNDEGHDRLLGAAQQIGLNLLLDEKVTPADVAMQFWLADPFMFAEKHNEHQFSRVASFQYFTGHPLRPPLCQFKAPDAATFARMVADMDEWFRRHNRGEQNTRIEVFEMEGEFWFIIRHGGTFSRMPTAGQGRTVRIIHFRPIKDDLLVYNPARHELRIHAGTKGERLLYLKTFEQRIFGVAGELSERRGYTLAPLLTDGPEALFTHDIPGINRIVLREVEMAWDNDNQEVTIRKAKDLFATAQAQNARRAGHVNPPRLVRASFDVYFGESAKPRKVQVRPPSTVQIGRYCDARRVHDWLSKRGFRGLGPERQNPQEVADAQLVAGA
jgi:hypothetical protein